MRKSGLPSYGLSAIFTTYWQANLASCISTAAGILQFPFGRFLPFVRRRGVLDLFWATLIFFSAVRRCRSPASA